MARRATSLGPKPSLFIIFCFFCFVLLFSFLSLLFNTQKTLVFPWKRTYFVYFECLPLFLLILFWPPPFSIYLSLSLSCSCPFFFLLVFLFAFFWFLFFSLSFLFFLLCFCFMKRTTSKYSIAFSSSSIFSLFGGFLSCFFFQIPFLIFAIC